MDRYNPKEIEPKWQKKWLEEKVFAAHEDSPKPKYYQLETFPYPSGAGLHVGHPKGYIAEDIHARYTRMSGKEVLYTMGWDAFGLPTENYALKVGKTPQQVTTENTDNFRRQVRMFGFSYDWDREINTSSPEYYKWTQWIFIQLFKKGLAYRAKAKVNWCPKDQTVLANEQVVNGHCDRCGSEIEERMMEQWMLRITDYADRLLSGLKGLDWPAATVKRQEDWIGKSEGALLRFPLAFPGAKPNHYVLLHGFSGTSRDNFFPWLKGELERHGHTVEAPDLPGTADPDVMAQTAYVLKNCHFDESTIVVGHSLGSTVALKVLEQLPSPIQGTVLVAGFAEPGFRDHARPFETKFDWKFDFEKIKRNAGGVLLLRDKTDSAVRPEQIDHLQEKIGGTIFDAAAAQDHFCAKEEPAVLDYSLASLTVFTTRPDTLFGATYLVLAPEHPWVALALDAQHDVLENKAEVRAYVEEASHKTDLMRQETAKEKTGIELKGVKAINPATKEEIPIWVADYVLGSYGTGAIMAVPAHDERDFAFAKKFGLPIRQVVAPHLVNPETPPRADKQNTKRNIIYAFVKHPKENKFIALQLKKFPWLTVVTGGVEEGETFRDAALREIKEETGYTSAKFVKEMPFDIFAEFYVAHKDVNRAVFSRALYFELENLDQEPLKSDEAALHDIVWLDEKELDTLHPLVEKPYILRWLREGEYPFTGYGVAMNSGAFDGMDSETAKWKIVESVGGTKKTQYKLRDWSVSRQRYWGVPIPMIHCPACGIVPLPEEDLPVVLPELENWRPKGTAPLASSPEFMNVKCPACGGDAQRDPETFDTFVDSSWYFLRYTDPHNNVAIFDKEKLKHWMPVDLYVIGAEHTVLHLLYSRFITKFLHDEGLFDFDEPFLKLRHMGLVRGADGQKMSKSKGNVVNPDDLIEEFGADTVRVYEMFMGPFEDGAPWDPKGILGANRFLGRFWKYALSAIEGAASDGSGAAPADYPKAVKVLHRAIKKTAEDIEAFKFNTAISGFMIALNEFEQLPALRGAELGSLMKLIHPFAPHMAQELWSRMGNAGYLDFEPWPQHDSALAAEDSVAIVIQVNGKVQDVISTERDLSEQAAKELALGNEKVKAALGGAEPRRVVYVKDKLVNIVL